MTKNLPSVEQPRILGLDVAKAAIVAHDAVTGRTFSIANEPKAFRKALKPFAAYDLWVCEATGGYERVLLDAALALGAPAHRACAARVKAFIKSHGGHAKSDAIDAGWLARFGAERFALLPRWTRPNPSIEEFAALVRLRQDMLAQRTQAKNRRTAPGCSAAAAFLDAQIDFLTAQLKAVDEKLKRLLREQPSLGAAEAALRAIPGIGPVAARTLIALLPELGSLSRKQAASLAGLAPHPNESGATTNRRRMTGGRASIRAALFMASLSAAKTHPRLKEFYQRLVAAGKPKRLALAAIARKLVVIANAVLKSASPKLT